jgi:hypothetical protein
MKNMMSISTKPEEEHVAAVLGPGLSPMLMEEVRRQNAPTISTSNSNSKIKHVHQGFRIEEEVVRLLAEEANGRQVSISSLVNTILSCPLPTLLTMWLVPLLPLSNYYVFYLAFFP